MTRLSGELTQSVLKFTLAIFKLLNWWSWSGPNLGEFQRGQKNKIKVFKTCFGTLEITLLSLENTQ